MITTNRLVHREATPLGLVVVTNLPGAQCSVCGTKQLDAGAVRLIEEATAAGRIHGDYLTTVSSNGKVPAIIVKEDLRRVLGIEIGAKLSWRVIDQDHAMVEVKREPRRT
jgi:hypothetical protein